MKKTLRLATLAAAALVALAVAGSALASFTPRFAVSHGVRAKGGALATTIHVTIPQADDPTAALTIYVPTGYTLQTAPVGTVVGQATASVFARDAGLTLPLEGSVSTDDPAKHTADVCSPGQNQAVWLLGLSVAGQAVTIPVYVNPTSGPVAAIAAYTIKVCLPPPDVPAGTPGRSANGAQLLDTKFTITNLFTAPAATATLPWRTLFTPYVPGRGAPNVLGTVEARSFVGLPGTISLKPKYVAKTNAYRLAGTVAAGSQGISGATVQIFRGRSAKALAKAATTKASASGAYATAGHLKPRKTTYFQTRVVVPERDDAAGCSAALPPFAATPPQCVSSTLGGFAAVSTVWRIKI